MPGIKGRLETINAIKAEAAAKKMAEKEKTAKELAEKRTGLEQEKAQVEGELTRVTDELQEAENGVKSLDLSDLEGDSRVAIESELVSIKEEMDNLRGKVAELTRRKQEIDEELKGGADETEKMPDDGGAGSKENVAAEQAENTEQDLIEMECQRPLSPEEQQSLDDFSKRLEQIQLTPEKLASIHDYNERVRNLPPEGRPIFAVDRQKQIQVEEEVFNARHKGEIWVAKDALAEYDPIRARNRAKENLPYFPLSVEDDLLVKRKCYESRLGNPRYNETLMQKCIDEIDKSLRRLREERKIQPKEGSELEVLLTKLEGLEHSVGHAHASKRWELRDKGRRSVPEEKRFDYDKQLDKRAPQTKYMRELEKLGARIRQVLES